MQQLKISEILEVAGGSCNMCPDTKRTECRCGVRQPGYSLGNFLMTVGKYATLGGIISFAATICYSFGRDIRLRMLYKIIF